LPPLVSAEPPLLLFALPLSPPDSPLFLGELSLLLPE